MQSASLILLICSFSLTSARPSDNLYHDAQSRRDTGTSPLLEPPGAAHALRDPSKLKYEIVGIVGAYLLWLIATIILVAIISSRRRRKNNATQNRQDMTMMKTLNMNGQVIEVPAGMKSPGLKSPVKLPSIRSWGKKSHKANPSDISISTVQSLESTAHLQNKAKDMDELTKLYAAVMTHDEERSQGQASTRTSPVIEQDNSPLSPGYPPEFAHLHNLQAATAARPNVGPTFNQPLHHPMAPTPTGDSFPQEARSHFDPNIPSRNSSRSNKATPMSNMSEMSSRAGSVASARSRPSHISVRGQAISQPIGSADLRDAHYYDETVPLSPRNYAPGPPPPTPGRKKQAQVSVMPIAEDVPSQSDYHNYQQQDSQYQQYQQGGYQQPLQSEQQQQQQQQYAYAPQPPKSPFNQPSLPASPRAKNAPAALTFRSAALNKAASSAAMTAHPSNAPKTLLFRDMYGDNPLRSAPPTKTTFLDRPDRHQNSGPRTGVVPSTPYSPYMPNTPMTPITPRRLMNKQELKAKRKEEKLQVLREGDLVEDDEDMWGK